MWLPAPTRGARRSCQGRLTSADGYACVRPRPTGISGLDAILVRRHSARQRHPGRRRHRHRQDDAGRRSSSIAAPSEFGEPGVIVVFEVSPDKLTRDAAGLGWDLPELERQDKLQDHLHHARGLPAGAAAGRQPAARRGEQDRRAADLHRRRRGPAAARREQDAARDVSHPGRRACSART